MEEVISGSEMEPEKRDSERRGEQQREDRTRCSGASAACCSSWTAERSRGVLSGVHTGTYSSWISYQSQYTTSLLLLRRCSMPLPLSSFN